VTLKFLRTPADELHKVAEPLILGPKPEAQPV
jgi:hypothetical protein